MSRIAGLLALSWLVACGDAGRFGADLSTRFADRGGARRAALPVAGLYYGELEVVLYDHRPGEAVQYDPNFGSGTDFSYWVALASGYEEARDNVLFPGAALDLAAVEGGVEYPPPSGAFAAEVGAFDVDFAEVYLVGTGLVTVDAFYGDTPVDADGVPTNGVGDAAPLYKYPDLADLPGYRAQMRFPGWAETIGGTSVLFARSDWFPEPVLVRLGRPASEYELAWSSRPLDAEQVGRLVDLANQGTQRRGMDAFVVVPYDGPVRVVLDDGLASTLPAAASEIPASQVELTVTFDLSRALSDASDLFADADRFAVPDPSVYWTGDANDVPFGVNLTFGDPPAHCGNGEPDGDETGLDCGGSCGGCVDPDLPVDCAGAAAPEGRTLVRFKGFLAQVEDPLGLDLVAVDREPFDGWLALDPGLVDGNGDASEGRFALADADDGRIVVRSAGLCFEATGGEVVVLDRSGTGPGDGDRFEATFGTVTPLPNGATSGQVRLALTQPYADRWSSDALPTSLGPVSAWTGAVVSIELTGTAGATVVPGYLGAVY